MNQPMIKFGQPAVKFIEIDESVVPYVTSREPDRGMLVFIDQEWGEVNKPVLINNLSEFTRQFGQIPDLFTSTKGLDYLPQELQKRLQGIVPMYAIRVGQPQGGTVMDDYKEMVEYGIGAETLKFTQKYQGLYGEDLTLIFSRDRINKTYVAYVAKQLDFKDHTTGLNSEMLILETFVSQSFADITEVQQVESLEELINENSDYVEIDSLPSTFISTELNESGVTSLEFVSQDNDGNKRTKTVTREGYEDLVQTVDDYNKQDSLEAVFSSQVLQSISNNYDFSNFEEFKIDTIPTLGLVGHSGMDNYTAFLNFLLINIQIPRKNTIVIQDAENTYDLEAQKDSLSGTPVDIKGSFMAAYYPWIISRMRGNDIFLPPSFFMVNKIYQIDPHRPLQGIRYGIVNGMPQKLFNDNELDYLSLNHINAITYFQDRDLTMQYNEKTRYFANSQLSRLSQRRIAIEIEQTVTKQLGSFLFEPLVQRTFNAINQTVEEEMSSFQDKGYVFEYLVELNTSPELLDNNMVIVTVKFKPMKFLEFIELNFTVRSYQQGV